MPRLTHVITAAMAAAVALTVTATVPAVAAQRHAASPSPKYYLALGDSLAVGVQPNAKGVDVPTPQGYADQLYATLKRTNPNLRLVKLGCPGETTNTLNVGGICGYRGTSRYSLTAKKGAQLRAATAFLRQHHGQIALITIDIGANDLNKCIALGDINKIAACLIPVFPAIAKNLTFTLTRLRMFAPHARLIGMDYYDPELAAWLTGPSGQTFATDSILLAKQFKTLLDGTYKAFKHPAADVFTAFRTADMKDMVTLPGIGTVPLDVALICEWTHECDPPPAKPDEHGNKAGYAVMAKAFLAKIHFPL